MHLTVGDILRRAEIVVPRRHGDDDGNDNDSNDPDRNGSNESEPNDPDRTSDSDRSTEREHQTITAAGSPVTAPGAGPTTHVPGADDTPLPKAAPTVTHVRGGPGNEDECNDLDRPNNTNCVTGTATHVPGADDTPPVTMTDASPTATNIGTHVPGADDGTRTPNATSTPNGTGVATHVPGADDSTRSLNAPTSSSTLDAGGNIGSPLSLDANGHSISTSSIVAIVVVVFVVLALLVGGGLCIRRRRRDKKRRSFADLLSYREMAHRESGDQDTSGIPVIAPVSEKRRSAPGLNARGIDTSNGSDVAHEPSRFGYYGSNTDSNGNGLLNPISNPPRSRDPTKSVN